MVTKKETPDLERKPTIKTLKEKLKNFDIPVPKNAKKDDLMKLCEENGLVARPPPEFKEVTKYCIVKCSLNRAMNLDGVDRTKFLKHVDKMVNVVSRMLRRGSLALAFHMTKLVSEGKPFPDLYKANDTYWKNWMRIGIHGVFPDNASRHSYDEIEEYLGSVLDADSKDESIIVKEYPTSFDQVLTYAGHTFKTIVTNNAWVPLFARLARLTKHKLRLMNIKTVTTYAVMNAIRSGTSVSEDFPDAVKEYVTEVRTRLSAAEGERLYDSYGKEEIGFDVMFHFNFWMQREFEAMKQRRIRLMPIFGVGRVHVRLDPRTLLFFAKSLLSENNTTLVELKRLDKLNDHRDPELYMFDGVPKVPVLKKKECKTEKEWEDYKLKQQKRKDDIDAIKKTVEFNECKERFDAYTRAQHAVCSTLFNDFVNKKRVRRGWKFDNSVSTDGVSISLQYSKVDLVQIKKKDVQKKTDKEKDLEATEYDRNLATNLKLDGDNVIVLGLDPGRNNIATITYLHVNENNQETSKCWKLTRGHYYVSSGVKRLNKKQRNRYASLIPKWTELGGVDIGLNTSNPDDIKAYLKVYDTFAEEWWGLSLKRRESWDSLQRYAGKRRVLDGYFAKVMKDIKKTFPDHKIRIAYGSAVTSMKATGKSEVAAPVGDAFRACKRIFNGKKAAVDIVYEARSTMVGWKSGEKKEMVYKKLFLTADGRLYETLHHTSCRKTPCVKAGGEAALNAYNERKRAQTLHRKGGGSVTINSFFQEEGQKEIPKIRYPEVRGLRFSKEDGMYHDRDREAAMTIGRLRCMELLGLPRPYPFDPRYKLDS